MIPVICGPTGPFSLLEAGARRQAADPWFFKAIVSLWDAGLATGIDPFVLAGQCGHETAWGHFGGAVTPDMGNTCGLKIRNAKGDSREDHANFGLDPFGYPSVGARAHADHLRLYCGFPVNLDLSPDPRAVWIKPGTKNFGSVAYVQDLGGKWAPSQDYGLMVEAKIKRLWGSV